LNVLLPAFEANKDEYGTTIDVHRTKPVLKGTFPDAQGTYLNEYGTK